MRVTSFGPAVAVVIGCLAVAAVSCGKSEPEAASPGPAADRAAAVKRDPVPPAPQKTGVIVNEREISQEQLDTLRQMYGAAPPKGTYWYDPRSGLYGYWGFEAAGYIRTGHDFGPLSERASRGNTGVFLNGREINMTEAMFVRQLFGVVVPGRWWLDGNTGYLGVEGNAMPVANLAMALRSQQQARGGGGNSEYRWRDGSGATISSDGNCTFAAIPGAPIYSSSGC